MCDCGVNKKTREQVRTASFAYQKSTSALIDSGVYDTSDDFTVVRQPFMEHMTVPTTVNRKRNHLMKTNLILL
jgi:phospholipase B1